MLREIVNRLRGQVWIRIEAAFPERVLNLCGARNLAFWDLEWESETTFTCRISKKDLSALRRAAEKLDCELHVLGGEGVPYFLRRFRHRTALVIGLILCGLGLFLGSFCIWEFSIEGNHVVSEEKILRVLEKNGVKLGTFGLALDGEDLRNHVLLDIPELSWIGVNVSGCKANVQVRERVMAPELLDEQTPTNVVARRDGLVLRVQALDGRACVLPGTSVAKGQLLISGIEDTETFGARLIAGMGTVHARTWYSISTLVPMTIQQKQYVGKEKTAVSVILGKKRIKFFSNSSIEGKEYDKITNRYPCSFLGISLPVTVVTETHRFYETLPAEHGAMEAERYGERVATEYLHTLVDSYGTVSKTLCMSRQKGNVLLVTVTAECEEEIGKSVSILTEVSEKFRDLQE